MAIQIMEFRASEFGIFRKFYNFENFENFEISIPQIHIQNIPLLQKIDRLAVSKINLLFDNIRFLIGYKTELLIGSN